MFSTLLTQTQPAIVESVVSEGLCGLSCHQAYDLIYYLPADFATVNPYHVPAINIGTQLRQIIQISGLTIYSMNQSAGKPVAITVAVKARSEAVSVEYIVTSKTVL